MKKRNKILLIILAIIFIVILAVIVAFMYKSKLNDNAVFLGTERVFDNTSDNKKNAQVKIYQGNDRPIAVMIDNHSQAMPHAGLSKAYIVYEIIVEGGESRLMALFKGQNIDKIGPVRSSRHYFLDYAMENDAIYVHYGWSPEAEGDINNFGINNINGLYDSNFWRVKDKKAPHNAVTSTEKILETAKSKNYRTTSTAKSVLNYVTNEVNLDEEYEKTSSTDLSSSNDITSTNTNLKNNSSSTNRIASSNATTSTDSKTSEIKVTDAKNITIPYSTSNIVKWVYDEQNKVYQRYSKGIKEVEWDTGKDVTSKNIIIEFIKNSALSTSEDDEEKGRQTMTTIGTKDGYYITNGKAIKITCEKTSRKSQTVYRDENGQEIKVNDGNTFIQICPIDSNVKIESE